MQSVIYFSAGFSTAITETGGGDRDRDSLCLLLIESWKLLATIPVVLSG